MPLYGFAAILLRRLMGGDCHVIYQLARAARIEGDFERRKFVVKLMYIESTRGLGYGELLSVGRRALNYFFAAAVGAHLSTVDQDVVCLGVGSALARSYIIHIGGAEAAIAVEPAGIARQLGYDIADIGSAIDG